jgi:SAM-dependent methyltransferase
MAAPAHLAPACRFCGAQLDRVFANLGTTPLANRNLRADEVAGEQRYPLIARICGSCLLIQVDDSVPAEAIFSNYDYFSSTSSTWVAHAKRYCDGVRARFGISSDSLVVEVGSNDGYLLQHFAAAGVPVLGVEPAANVAALANAQGMRTEVAFFGAATARRLVGQARKADLMVANNVLAHVSHIRDFVAGFAELLSERGVATFEFPHVLNLIDQIQFDTIYHEHFSYLSLNAVERIMASARLRVFDVEILPTHGGSLRLFVCHDASDRVATANLGQLRARERERGLDRLDGYSDLTGKIAAIRSAFLEFMARAARERRVVAAYGAAAKGNTFLNVCGVTYPEVRAVYDKASAKQGKLTPGSHIPILAPERIVQLEHNPIGLNRKRDGGDSQRPTDRRVSSD